MKNVQVRFPEEQLKFIDQMVKEGKYASRSEAIRDCVRKTELLEVMEKFTQLTQQVGLTKEEALKELEAIRHSKATLKYGKS